MEKNTLYTNTGFIDYFDPNIRGILGAHRCQIGNVWFRSTRQVFHADVLEAMNDNKDVYIAANLLRVVIIYEDISIYSSYRDFLERK